jgi:hypothetical protein
MTISAGQYTAPGIFLFAYVAIAQLTSGLYLAAELQPPPILFFISPFGFLWAAACWFQRDMQSRGFRWSLDVGFVLYVTGVLLVPYYLLKTRGPRAILVMIGFVAVYYVSLLVGIALFILIAPQQ